MIGAAVVVVVALGAQLASATGALEKCRALDKEFDTKNMPKPCQAAADDSTLSIPERVEALRRLAFAHIVNGDDALAEPAFMKMLVFQPNVELPADAGPKFRELFGSVKKRFDAEGKLVIKFVPPPNPKSTEPVTVQLDVGDKLGRVVGARIQSTTTPATSNATTTSPAGAPTPSTTAPGANNGSSALEDKLVRNELEPGQLRFTGVVPEPKEPATDARTVSYDIVFEGWDGQPIATQQPVHGSYVRPSSTAGAANGDDGGGFPWLIAGGVGGVGVLAIGGAAAGLIWCYNAGPCRTQEAWVRVQIHQGGT